VDESELITPARDRAAEDIAVERDAAFEVAHPEHDVIDLFEFERGRTVHVLSC
jgi:hypothetical protein